MVKDIALVMRANGEEKYRSLEGSAYYETAKITGDQSD
jgi:hypothetical protein